MKKKKAYSGPSLTDDRRAELGQGRLTLRLPVETIELLDEMAEQRGLARWAIVDQLIREESRRKQRKI